MTKDQEGNVLERMKSLVENNAIRKKTRVKGLSDGTFWEYSLSERYYVIVSQRLQRTSIVGLIFILHLLINLLNTLDVPGPIQSTCEDLHTIPALVKGDQ